MSISCNPRCIPSGDQRYNRAFPWRNHEHGCLNAGDTGRRVKTMSTYADTIRLVEQMNAENGEDYDG